MRRFRWFSVAERIPWLPPEPYMIPGGRCADLTAVLESAGFFVGRLDGTRIASQHDLLREIGEALEFPDYYGCNWDALHDCIGDLPADGKARAALVWHDSHLLLGRSAHDFVRSVTLLTRMAEDVSALHGHRTEPDGQLEVFFGGDW